MGKENTFFTVKKIKGSGRTVIVELMGEITIRAEKTLLELQDWSQGLGEGKWALIFNFREVSYMSSAGLTLLMRMVRMGAYGTFVSFAYGLTVQYRRLFRILGLTQFVMIYPDESTILNRLNEVGKLESGFTAK